MNELECLQQMASIAQMGWCEIERSSNTWLFSEYSMNLLNLSENTLGFSAFIHLIREDYRERIAQEFSTLTEQSGIEVTFPISKSGVDIWVFLRLSCKDISKKSFFGFIQRIEPLSGNHSDASVVERVNNLLYQQNAISRLLLDLVRDEKVDEVINFILSELLQQFRGGRTYIFEYQFDRHLQQNTYEVVSENVTPQIHLLQELSTDITPWWTRQMIQQKPIILNTMEDFPPEVDDRERHVLIDQGINSLMVAPLVSGERTWGFIGIDIVVGFRHWSKEDWQWFTSLANMISICIELRRVKDDVVRERCFLQNLYHHMPMGYLQVSLREKNKLGGFDFILNDANELSTEYTGKSFVSLVGQKISCLEIGYGITSGMLEKVSVEKGHQILDIYYPESRKYCHCILYSPEVDKVVILLLDMTATIKANEAFERSRKMFENVFDNCPVGIEIYNAEGALVDLNKKDLEIFGTTKEAVIGVNFFANPNVSDDIKERVRRNEIIDFRLNYSFENAKEEGYYTSERPGVIELYSKMSPLYNASGTVTSYILINIDNTEQRDAINRIQDFEHFFLLISNYAKLGYVKANLLTKEGYAIQQWLKNIGEDTNKDLKEVLGVYRHLHPDDREKVLAFYRDAIAGKQKTFKAEIRVHQPEEREEWCWLLMNAMVTEWQPDENKVEVIEVNYDITSQKSIERKLIEARDKAETADQLKSAFLANMSHEIRTPLNAIIGFSNLLMETEDIEERKEYMNIVQSNNECLLQLISDILDLAKIESDTFEIEQEEVNISEICLEIYQVFSLKVKKEVELVWEGSAEPIYIFSDGHRIRQIMNNLLSNAVKYTSQGSIRIGYELQNNEELLIYVQDTGTGIAQDRLEEIFERFIKLNSFIPGTGLGLAICQTLVRRLGGKIGVDSQEGKGSRFWFTLPCVVNVDNKG